MPIAIKALCKKPSITSGPALHHGAIYRVTVYYLFLVEYYTNRLQATNSSARPDVSIEQSQGFQTVRCLIGC